MASILIVDDEPDIRFLIRHIFELAGHEVREAPNDRRAIVLIEESVPDLLVTDMMMPVMGGSELIARIRSDPALSSLAILAVTGNPGHAGGADATLSKPFSPRELAAVATSLLAARV